MAKFEKTEDGRETQVFNNNSHNMRNIVFEKINNRFSKGIYKDFEFIIKNSNGYINAAKLCLKYNKENKDKPQKDLTWWLRNKDTIGLIEELQLLVGSTVKVIMYCKGNNQIKGTYIHPRLITDIMRWISKKFAVKISEWIEEWRNYSKENNFKYWKAIATCKASNNDDREHQIQRKLQKELGGEIEVSTRSGSIDLLTNDLIIEIKEYRQWKSALGQILAYSIGYVDHKKIIYLFDVPNDHDLEYIEMVCNKSDIEVRIIDE